MVKMTPVDRDHLRAMLRDIDCLLDGIKNTSHRWGIIELTLRHVGSNVANGCTVSANTVMNWLEGERLRLIEYLEPERMALLKKEARNRKRAEARKRQRAKRSSSKARRRCG